MPIDTHVRVAACLHILMGALGVCTLLFLGMIFGVFGAAAVGATHGGGPEMTVIGWLVGLGSAFFVILIAFVALEIVGAVMLLNGSPAGRVLTIGFSVLSLLNIPFGTAVGAYSLWALLREVPAPVPAPAAMSVPSGPAGSY